MADWQPIDTAPRDGSEILTVFFDYISGEVWVYQIAYADVDGIVVNDGRTILSHAAAGYMLWQPLPEPPADDEHEPEPDVPSAEDMADMAETAAARPHLEARAAEPWRRR